MEDKQGTPVSIFDVVPPATLVAAALVLLVLNFLVQAIVHDLGGGPVASMVVAALTMFVAMPAFLLLRFHVGDERPAWPVLRDELALDGLEWREIALLVVIAVAALMPLHILGEINLRFAEVSEEHLEWQRTLLPSGPGEALWTLLGLGVIVPIGEEIVFRGIVQQAARVAVGPVAGVVVTGVVFAVAHLLPWATLPLILTGVILALCYEVTGSLLAPIVMHVVHNLLVLGIWMQQGEGDGWSLDATAITAAVICLALVALTLRALESRGNQRAGESGTTSSKS